MDPLNLQGTPVAEPEPRLQPTTIRKAQRSTVQKIEELHKENIPLCGTRKNQDTVSRKPVSISPLNANRPNPFILPRTTAPLIGSGESMRKKIIAATEMHTILAYLEESNFSQADILLRNMKCLGRELTKLAESSGFDDAENLSEEMTSRYFKIFQRRLLDTVVVAVCRGMSSNPSFYGPLCQMLNEYLHKCGLYTRSVEVGRRAVDADFNDMRSIPQVVHDPKKNAMIAQVERLPYYIDYKTEEGTEGYFFYEGRMVIMKYQKEHNG
ncbi:MAG: hypothetical protein IJU76_15320 [Desulfovibrionaceae bacterium]|nr:hypothetical protein [Desulfovibrionaceae bacterium]